MRNLLLKLCAAALVATSAAAANVQAADLHVMSSGGFTAAYKVLGPKFASETGNSLDTALGPSMGKSPEAIPNRLERGEPADAVIMVGYALDELIKQGKVMPGSRVELADSRIGMVVREGAAKPDIGSAEGLRQTLLHAKSIAYSDSASGVYIERELFKKLGIEDQVKSKATARPFFSRCTSGFSAETISTPEKRSREPCSARSAASRSSAGSLSESVPRA